MRWLASLMMVVLLCGAQWFVATDGNDSNDGHFWKDMNATNWTWNPTAGTITGNGNDFEGFVVGEIIYVSKTGDEANNHGWYYIEGLDQNNDICTVTLPGIEVVGMETSGSTYECVAGPELTIAAAIVDASTGDTIWLASGTYDDTSQGAAWRFMANTNEDLTFSAIPGHTVICKPSHGTCGIYWGNTTASRPVKFTGMTIQPTSANLVVNGSNVNNRLTFEDCTLTCGAYKVLACSNGHADAEYVFDTCTISSTNADVFTVGWARAAAGKLFEMTDCIVASVASSAGYVLDLDGYWDRVRIVDSTFGTSDARIPRSCVYPGDVDRVNYYEVSGCTIYQTTLSSGGPFYAVGLPNVPVINTRISGNTINMTSTNSRVVWGVTVSSDTTYSATNHTKSLQLLNNTISTTKNDTNCYAVRIGQTVRGGSVIGNTIYGGDWGIYATASGLDISNNKVLCMNPMVLWGLTASTVRRNSCICTATGGNRVIVLGRCTFHDSGAGPAAGTVFSDTTVDFGDGSVALDTYGAIAKLAAGYRLMVVTEETTGTQQYGWVSDIADDTDVVTVDDWYDRGIGVSSAANPTDGVRAMIVLFPEGNTIIDNIFDAYSADTDVCITYDFNPTFGEDYIDYNYYGIGTGEDLTNLDRYGMGSTIATLAALQAKWLTWSRTHQLNDAHSVTTETRLPAWSGLDLTTLTNTTFRSNLSVTASDGGTIGAWQRQASGSLFITPD